MMKNKFNFLITGLMSVLIAGVFSFGIANASNSSIYISPGSLDKKVGDTLVLVTTVDTDGSKVCAVEGELQLDNELSCQSIVMGEGLMPQKAPSCTDLSFLIGIPNCTTVNKTLFTVALKADKKGTAVVSFVDVDVMGEGFSLSTASVGGSYTLTSVPVPVPKKVITPTPTITKDCVCEDWGEWIKTVGGECGQGGCDSNQVLQIRERSCDPVSCEVEVENSCVADSSCLAGNDFQTASVKDVSNSMGVVSWVFLGLILLILVIIISFYSGKKNR